LVASCLTFAVAAAASYSTSKSGSSMFIATGPGGLKIKGNGDGVTVSESGGNITVSAPIGDLKTGISLRDDHLKKALKAGKDTKATLVVSRAKINLAAAEKAAAEAGKKEATAKCEKAPSASGTFTMNGKKVSRSFRYLAKKESGGYSVFGCVDVKLTEHGLEPPSYLGVGVDDKVAAMVKFHVVDK
jgi:hypothetical protein